MFLTKIKNDKYIDSRCFVRIWTSYNGDLEEYNKKVMVE